jgi:hypothetical protein
MLWAPDAMTGVDQGLPERHLKATCRIDRCAESTPIKHAATHFGVEYKRSRTSQRHCRVGVEYENTA